MQFLAEDIPTSIVSNFSTEKVSGTLRTYFSELTKWEPQDKPLRLIQGEVYIMGSSWYVFCYSYYVAQVPGFVAAFSRSVPMWLCLSLKRQGKCRVNKDELKLNFMDSKVSSLILRREKLIKLPTVRLSERLWFWDRNDSTCRGWISFSQRYLSSFSEARVKILMTGTLHMIHWYAGGFWFRPLVLIFSNAASASGHKAAKA